MRKENEIYCSNCGVIIKIDSRFCSGCGFEQLDYKGSPSSFSDIHSIKKNKENSSFEKNVSQEVLVEKSENKIYTKWWFWLIAVILLGALYPKKSSTNLSSESPKSNSSENNCIGVGNQSCIDKVRQNFNNTGKTILGEEYLGDGRFGISFLDSQYAGAYNATISTDCNCNVINSNVKTVR